MDNRNLYIGPLSGRTFRMNEEDFSRGIVFVKNRIMNELLVSLNDFFGEVDLSKIELGDMFGWTVDHMFDIEAEKLERDYPDFGIFRIKYKTAPKYLKII